MKNQPLLVGLDAAARSKLEAIARKHYVSRAEVVRRAIHAMHAQEFTASTEEPSATNK